MHAIYYKQEIDQLNIRNLQDAEKIQILLQKAAAFLNTEGRNKVNKCDLEPGRSKRGPQHNWGLSSQEEPNPCGDWSTKDGWYLYF